MEDYRFKEVDADVWEVYIEEFCIGKVVFNKQWGVWYNSSDNYKQEYKNQDEAADAIVRS